MKKIIYAVLLLIISCSSNSQVLVKKINNPVLAELLMFSELKDLNKLQTDIDKNLWVKIYRLPNTESNNCFPESHGVCSYKYYVAASQLDDSPVFNVYYLGILGEVIEYKWVYTASIDKAIIKITANKYSNEALNYNKELENEKTKYKIVITANNLVINEVKKNRANE